MNASAMSGWAARSASASMVRRAVRDSSRLQAASLPVLEQRKAIARVSAPPLIELPGWKIRGAKLEKAGIVTVEAFLDTDGGTLAKAARTSPDMVAKWKEEVIGLLTTPQPRG